MTSALLPLVLRQRQRAAQRAGHRKPVNLP